MLNLNVLFIILLPSVVFAQTFDIDYIYCDPNNHSYVLVPRDTILLYSSLNYPNTIFNDTSCYSGDDYPPFCLSLQKGCTTTFYTQNQSLWFVYQNAFIQGVSSCRGCNDFYDTNQYRTPTRYSFTAHSDGFSYSITPLPISGDKFSPANYYWNFWQAFKAQIVSYEDETICPLSNRDLNFKNTSDSYFITSFYSTTSKIPGADCVWQLNPSQNIGIRIKITYMNLTFSESLSIKTNDGKLIFNYSSPLYDFEYYNITEPTTISYNRTDYYYNNHTFGILLSAYGLNSSIQLISKCSGNITFGGKENGFIESYNLSYGSIYSLETYQNFARCEFDFTVKPNYELIWDIYWFDIEKAGFMYIASRY